MPTLLVASFQSDCGTSPENDGSGLLLDGDADNLAQSTQRDVEIEDSRNGKPLPLHHAILLAGKVF